MWINDRGKVRAVVTALADEYSRKIIATTLSVARSPEEISIEEGIPMSTTYRRIRELLALSMIKVSKIDLENGKKSVYYKSAYKHILVKFDSNDLEVELIPDTNTLNENPSEAPSPETVTQDCDFCQSTAVCKIFVAGASKSHFSVCQLCEKKMHERSTIRAVEEIVEQRMALKLLREPKSM